MRLAKDRHEIAALIFSVWYVGLNLAFTARALILNLLLGRKHVDPYQAWWVGVVGPFVLLGAWFIRRRRTQLPCAPSLGFLLVALLGVLAEEATCFFLGVGIFSKHGNAALQYLQGSLALYLACIGGWIAYRRLALTWMQASVMFGFSGFFLEAFPFQKLYRRVPPILLYGTFPPVVGLHFIVMSLLAYLLVCERVESGRRWDHPLKWVLAFALPALMPTLLVLICA